MDRNVEAGMVKANQAALILMAGIVLTAFLYFARSVVAPITFAWFVVILVWPIQHKLQLFANRYVALMATFILVAVLLVGFGWLTAWASSQAARRILMDGPKFQILYSQLHNWLEMHGVSIAALWIENFNMSWALGTIRAFGSQLNGLFSFWFVSLLYILLGLAEVNELISRIGRLKNRTAARLIRQGCQESAAKIRGYMLLRTGMSVATGFLVWLLVYSVGLPLAPTWGLVAFILNFIPFLGPLIATVLITSFAALQFQDWQFVLIVFVCLNLIQAIIGSFIEPRMAGVTLSLSPLAVLFSVFAGGALWGVFGAFIGVPITIAFLTFCSLQSSTSWVAELFGFQKETSTASVAEDGSGE